MSSGSILVYTICTVSSIPRESATGGRHVGSICLFCTCILFIFESRLSFSRNEARSLRMTAKALLWVHLVFVWSIAVIQRGSW